MNRLKTINLEAQIQGGIVMAIVRCKCCGLNFDRTKREYHREPFEPIGYPNIAALCGLKHCPNPGLVRLQKDEFERYTQGERCFDVKTWTVKIKVQ